MGKAGSGGGVGGEETPLIAILSSSLRKQGPITTGGGSGRKPSTSSSKQRSHGVWVPACAGTTTAPMEAPVRNGAPRMPANPKFTLAETTEAR